MKGLNKTKFMSGVIAVALGFSMFLPTFKNVAKADVEHVIRDYSELTDTDAFMIGGYYGGDAYTDSGIALLKGAGLDFTTMTGNHSTDYCAWGTPSDKVTTIYNKLHDAGLKVLLAGGRGTVPATTGMQGVTAPNGGFPYDYSAITNTAGVYGAISELGLGLPYTDVVLGTEFWDEPLDEEIDFMDEFIERYESAFPDKLFFVNLIAREGITTDLNSDGKTDVLDYVYYVNHYANNVTDNLSGRKMISTDPYPFNRANVDSSAYYYINPNYFTTLATSAIIAKAHGADLSYYVQTMDCSQESHTYKNSRDVKGQADISMQYNIAMAFGAKQIINFCYETADVADPFMSEAMLSSSGTPTSRYTWVKNAADAAHSIGEAYMRFNWNGTIVAKGTMNDRFSSSNNKVRGGTSFDCYADLNNSYYRSLVPYATAYNSNSSTRTALSGNNLLNVASSRTALVGCFTDDAGYNGYMLASGDDAVSNTATAMALTFDSSTEKVRIYRGIEYSDVDLDDHTLNISLSAGEGAFVIPYKATEVNSITIKVEGVSDETVKVETGGDFIFPDRLSGVNEQKALVGYICNGALYPVGYTMTDIDSDMTLTAVFADLTMQRGASVRIDSDKEHAIRWKANISKADYDNLKKKYTVQGYGFTIMSKSRKGALNIEVPFDKFVEGDNNDYVLAGVMTNVEDADLCEVFEARAFVKIRFSNGVTKRIYARGNSNDRSIAYVAAMALADEKITWSPEKAERLRLLSASYTHDDNIGSLNDWIDQTNGDNVGSLDYWLRLLAQNGN